MTDPSGASVNGLEGQLRTVVFWRDAYARAKGTMEARQRAFEIANAEAILSAASARTQLASAEMEARDLALAAYAETGSKSPHPGVGIRVVTRLVYDPIAALGWAREHDLALQLNVRTFEALAKNGAVDEIVAFHEETTATIAADLSKSLDIEPVQR